MWYLEWQSPKALPHISVDPGPVRKRTLGQDLKTRAYTCLHGFEDKDSIIQSVVVIIHVTLTQVWQSGDRFNNKTSFAENFR